MTESMQVAIDETDRRRAIQVAYNVEHGIEPTTIVKGIHDLNQRLRAVAESTVVYASERGGEFTDADRAKVEALVARMEAEMRAAAKQLEFERAAALRDEIQQIRLRVLEQDASITVGRAAERAGREAAGRSRPDRCRRPGAGPTRRGRGAGRGPSWRSPASRSCRPTRSRCEPGRRATGVDENTIADWLPGIRDEHDDDTGWQARWLDRPTWDRTVTPNIRKRTGAATGPSPLSLTASASAGPVRFGGTISPTTS